MAVRRPEAGTSVASAVAIEGPLEMEPTPSTDCNRKKNYSESGKCLFLLSLFSLFKRDFTLDPLVLMFS